MNPPFLGSRVVPGGVEFRVWATNATAVKVFGDFNNWDHTTAISLDGVGDGYWEATTDQAHAGSFYRLLLRRKDNKWDDLLDPAARDTLDSRADTKSNHGIVVDPTYDWSPWHTPAFDDLIMYQCHVGSFSGRNDGLDHEDHVASIQDASTNLDYIRSMGFNAIALMPIQEFRSDRSWGYNPAQFFAPESAYGKPEDFRAFVDLCHQKGMAVIFDVVYNHVTSDDDNVFREFDQDSDDNNRTSYMSDVETQWGGRSLAIWKQPIKDFFLENMRMYFEEYNADGLRFDSTRTLEANHGWDADGWQFMQYLTSRGKELFPGKFLIAEHVPAESVIITSAGFHATWVKEAYDHARSALSGQNVIDNLARTVPSSFGYGQDYPYSWSTIRYLLGSHDDCGDMKNGDTGHRYLVELLGGRDNWYARAKCRLAWALNAAVQGLPMLFMGGECHMPGYWHDGQDNNGDHRFDWDVAGDPIAMPMRRLVAAANQARWDHPALRSGALAITHYDIRNGVLAFRRWNNEGDVVLVVVNAGEQSFGDKSYNVVVGQSGRWQQFLCSQDAAFGGWDDAGNAYYEPWTEGDGTIAINLPKWSVSMFRLL